MEDQVPFKVFTYWSEDSKPEVRRFGVEKTVVTSYHYLNAKLQDIYPGLRTRSYTVTWKDEDGDDITISSDEEMMTALTALHGNLIKLDVHVSGDEKEDVCEIVIDAINPSGVEGCPMDMTHYSVTCDGCNSKVVGFRYKCTSCYDFDLCSKCESAGLHPEHFMVRLPSPVVPRALVKAAIKRSRHFLKTVASSAPGDAHKRHRREREHSAHSRPDRQDHCRRPRTSWLETFTTYMNEFANLAGDPVKQQEQAKAEAANAENAQAKASTENAQATSQAGNPQPNIPGCPLPGMENIPKLIEMYFNGTLATYLQNAAAAGSDPTSNTPTSNETPAPPTSNEQRAEVPESKDVEMKESTPKPAGTTHYIKTEVAPSTSGEGMRDASPDKIDGWTFLNKDKELVDINDGKPSAPGETQNLIGFNLPTEFQERVRITEGQNLYPPLNATTAVLNPKEPMRPTAPHVVRQPQPPHAPFAPQAPAPPQAPRPAQPQQESRDRHPLAHIDAAIEHMLAMGFTNEGGWLTKLLESKDGNIAAVLDLLTPPKTV